MTENDPEFSEELDQSDLEVPDDGRDGQPPEEGSSDEPETLEAEDPLAEDDWALEEEQIIDPDELEEKYQDDSQ